MSLINTASNPTTASAAGTASAILSQSNQFMRVVLEPEFDTLGINKELNQQ